MSDICASERMSLPAAALASIRRTFPYHLPFYFTALIFGAATIVITHIYQISLPFDALTSFLLLVPKFLVLGICMAVLFRLFTLFRMRRSQSPLFGNVAKWLGARAWADDRIGNIVHTIIPLMPLAVCFSALKDEIPRIHPFAWDATFMQWSRMLGLGHMPWQILQPVFGSAPAATVLNLAYDAWFILMFGCLFWQAFAARGSILRMQFLLAFACCWFVGGNVLAAIFSSAGPCYYGHIVPGPNPYAEQMALLRNASEHWPIWSVQIQDMLWSSYTTGRGEISGISAMPSMHVTIAVLIALLGWRTDRRLGIAFAIFAILIFVGSIVLGWHYAVDGIAAVGLATLSWASAGWCARSWYGYVAQLEEESSSAVAAPAQ